MWKNISKVCRCQDTDIWESYLKEVEGSQDVFDGLACAFDSILHQVGFRDCWSCFTYATCSGYMAGTSKIERKI